jgi:hypothetical protein
MPFFIYVQSKRIHDVCLQHAAVLTIAAKQLG